MSKLCQFGNCKVIGSLPVKVSIRSGEERVAFCSEVHAAAWLLTVVSRHHEINARMTGMAAYEILKPQLERDGGL